MKLEINKELLLESVFKQDAIYVYHIGKKGYKDIRPLKFLKDHPNFKIASKRFKNFPEKLEEYLSEINAFLGPVSEQDLLELKNKGFKQYQNIDNLYLYKINLNSSKNRSKIKKMEMTSIKEQLDFNNKNWDNFYKKNKELPDKEWFKNKELYFKKQHEFIINKGIKYKNLNINTLKNNSKLQEWSDVKKWFKYNSIHGNKEQYASCIPHIQISVSAPLEFESVQKLGK
jgi:hypothetical protein